MAKSIRSKIKKRFRTAKRQRVEAMVVKPRTAENHAKLQRVIDGQDVRLKRPKNAFKHPEADGAVFPQHEIMKKIDFRSSHLPMAGYAFSGNRRKYEGVQKEEMDQLILNSHPKMQVLAGGGAIDAKTGKRISLMQAELQATAADSTDPVAAAAARNFAGQDFSAAAAAENEDDAEMGGEAGLRGRSSQDDAEPLNAADHSRVPVLKDARRQARAVEHRSRANASKSSRQTRKEWNKVPEPTSFKDMKLAVKKGNAGK